MGVVYIYGLVDPRDNNIFYIGFTQYLKKRYNVHLNVDGFRREQNLYKDNIIRKILQLGLKPEMKIIDECEYKFNPEINMYEHERLEIEQIKKYRELGGKLANLTIGGDGGVTHKRKVYQYSEDGKFLEKYLSVNDVALKYGVNGDIISKVIDQRRKKSYRGTYLFSSKENAKLFQFKKTKKDNIPIVQYSPNGELLNEFRSQKEASRTTKVPQPNINHCLKNKRKYAGGFSWEYKNN